MASAPQKAFCVLCFSQCDSVITVQRDFLNKYVVDPPTSQSIRRWYTNNNGCAEELHYNSSGISNSGHARCSVG
ncbi:hypothetical protein J6590_070872 [Homalodisca vitripennis]|nr:hypothetical protein J6590_070872 [Homalodisca vitripennis]